MVRAFDESDNIVAQSIRQANTTIHGFYTWESLYLSVGENIITRVMFYGTDGCVAIDDLQTCRLVNQPPGWDQGNKSGWDGSMPPGLDKKDKTPPGFNGGNKSGWE